MALYFVEYTYRDDEEHMSQVRPRHREFFSHLYDQGVVKLVGPFKQEVEDERTDDQRGAIIIIAAESANAALRILDDDPFKLEGFITKRRVRHWVSVYSPFAE